MVVADEWAVLIEHVPPDRREHGGSADVRANDDVAEEQPAADEWVLAPAKK